LELEAAMPYIRHSSPKMRNGAHLCCYTAFKTLKNVKISKIQNFENFGPSPYGFSLFVLCGNWQYFLKAPSVKIF
jgi:hypothetical protein